jgi:hypothetical protein
MIGMLVIIAMGVIQTAHENQMAEEKAAVQQQQVIEQGKKAKANTQWKLDHHNGTIPAYKD